MHRTTEPEGDTREQALATLRQAQARRAPVALLLVESGDHTSGVAGHAALARRLRASVRAGDAVCHLGAAGSAVVLVGVRADGAARAATRLAGTLGVPVAVVALAPGETPEAALAQLDAQPAPVTSRLPYQFPATLTGPTPDESLSQPVSRPRATAPTASDSPQWRRRPASTLSQAPADGWTLVDGAQGQALPTVRCADLDIGQDAPRTRRE